MGRRNDLGAGCGRARVEVVSAVTVVRMATRQALLGGFRDWGGRGPFYGTGYYGDGGLGLLLLVVLLLVAIGRV